MCVVIPSTTIVKASGQLMIIFFRTARLMIMSARDARGPEDEDYERRLEARSPARLKSVLR
jgi:hypothetical protein